MAAVTFKAFKATLASGDFAPVYVFHGGDDYLKEEHVDAVVERATDAATRDFNCDILRGDEVELATLSAALESLPMLAERRVVVLHDPGGMKKPLKDRLSRYLAQPANDTVLLLVVPAAGKADAWITERACVLEFKALEDVALRKWVAHEAQSACGVHITEGAAERLAQYGGSDLALLSGELRKLAAYCDGGTIDEVAVEAITGVRPEVTLADLLDRAAMRDTAGAIAMVGDLLAQPKESGVTTVMALTTQMLAIGWGVAARGRGVPQGRLGSEYFALLKEAGNAFTGRSWGDATKVWATAVSEWTAEDIARAIPHLAAADAALKDTKVSSDAQIVTSLLLAILPPTNRRSAA